MTNCTQKSFEFPACKKRVVEANFQGGDISSDGGVLLLRQVDRQLGLALPWPLAWKTPDVVPVVRMTS